MNLFGLLQDRSIKNLSTYLNITTLKDGIVKFNPYESQEDIFDHVEENRYSVIVSARQTGTTTALVAILANHLLFSNDKTAVFISNKFTDASDMREKLMLAIDDFIRAGFIGIETYNKSSIRMNNGSTIYFSSAAWDSLRGRSIDLLVMDNTAFFPHSSAGEFFSNILPTIAHDYKTKIVIASNPYLAEGLFWEVYTSRNFAPIRIHWDDVPGRDTVWKEKIIGQIGKENFAVQYQCKFAKRKGA